jgi:hypothetical protein
MEAFEDEVSQARIVVHTGHYPPRLSRTTKRFLQEHDIIVVALPWNGRERTTNLIHGENTP